MGFDLTPALQIKHRRQLSFTKITAANSYIPNIISPDYTKTILNKETLWRCFKSRHPISIVSGLTWKGLTFPQSSQGRSSFLHSVRPPQRSAAGEGYTHVPRCSGRPGDG